MHTDITPQQARKIIQDSTDIIDAVRTWANCLEADVDKDGDVWISGPQRGHWLNDDDLVKLAVSLQNC